MYKLPTNKGYDAFGIKVLYVIDIFEVKELLYTDFFLHTFTLMTLVNGFSAWCKNDKQSKSQKKKRKIPNCPTYVCS